MPQYPNTVMDLYSLTDIGKRLNDPGPAYKALQMMFGWQIIIGTAASPGPLASMAVNVVNGPPLGTGNSVNVQLPFALAGRSLTIINLAASTLNFVLQSYNPATEKADTLILGVPMPVGIGTINTFLAYQPGAWVLTSSLSEPVPDILET